MHVDAKDTWTYEDQTFPNNQYAPLYRWRNDWQSDFAARMDWCVKPWGRANHQPHPVVNGDRSLKPIQIQAQQGQQGQQVVLDAGASTDPDEDKLRTMHEITSRFAAQLHRIFGCSSIAESST